MSGYMGMGLLLDLTGRHARAVESFEAGLELDPDSLQCLHFRAIAYHNLRRFEEALGSFRKVTRQNPGHPLARQALLYEAVELGLLGRLEEQALALETAERTFKSHPKMWFNLLGMAGVAAQRGNDETALAWLRQAAAAGMTSINRLQGDPALEPLRDDPRFQDLLERMSFPE